MSDLPILTRLMRVIESRREDRPEHSYTARLFGGGVDKIGVKVSEESGELIEAALELEAAAKAETSDSEQTEIQAHVVHEAADLIYHTLVLLAHSEIALEDVELELARRFGISGLDEKASREN
jgi:phosphoribosyl-ATP pyrophosphohydrolase